MTLEVESDDEINLDDEYIEWDLRQEISCTSNTYDILSIKQILIQDGESKSAKEKV